MERFDWENNTSTVKPNNKNVNVAVRIEEGIFKAATDAMFNPSINFTAGSVGWPHVGIGNARATKARGRNKTTKNLPRVTKQKMQRQALTWRSIHLSPLVLNVRVVFSNMVKQRARARREEWRWKQKHFMMLWSLN